MALRVYFYEDFVGLLSNDGGSISFQYESSYLERDDAQPLSLKLPLQSEAFNQRQTQVFFANLLPEGDAKNAIATGVGVSEGNVFALLARFGGDCAGAVTILDAQDEASPVPIESRREEIPSATLDQILTHADQRPPVLVGAGARLSLAGAQHKLPVIYADDRFWLPTSSSDPTTHILKPASRRFPNLVDNEFFCMRLAGLSGLRVAKVERRLTESGFAFLMVERYDRRPLNGSRLHQEDICQALGFLPNEKYQADGGPTLRDAFSLIDVASVVPAHDKLALWDAVIFNFLIGNCDAHGKNFSLLYKANAPCLAPLYDLVSTDVYAPSLTEMLAMSIGSAKTLKEVRLDSFGDLAKHCGLNVKLALRRCHELAEVVIDQSRQLAAQLGPLDDVVDEIAVRIGQRGALL